MSQLTHKKDPARELASRQAYLGKSNLKIENETEGVIYQKLLSRLKKGQKSLDTLDVKEIKALLFAFEWTPQQFEELTNIKLPTITLEPALPNVEVNRHVSVAIPTFILTVSNGKGEVVSSTKQIQISSTWTGQYNAYIIEETETHVHYLVTKHAASYFVGDDLLIAHPQKGTFFGRLEALIENTFVIRTQDKTLTFSHGEIDAHLSVVVRNARDRKEELM